MLLTALNRKSYLIYENFLINPTSSLTSYYHKCNQPETKSESSFAVRDATKQKTMLQNCFTNFKLVLIYKPAAKMRVKDDSTNGDMYSQEEGCTDAPVGETDDDLLEEVYK